MFKTRVSGLFDTEYPIVQGGMRWVAGAELASAVSNAGGLGMLAALSHEKPEQLAEEIHKTRELTDKPFGVNVTLVSMQDTVDFNEYFDVIEREGIRVVETAGRSPNEYIEKLKGAGIKIIHKCTSVRLARDAQKLGCDAVIIDGFEGADQSGEDNVGSLVLIPATAGSLKIPVIASGGIADGRGFVAALALGAEGISMGTRFLMTQEAPVSPIVKGWLLQAYENDTLLVPRTKKKRQRVLTTPVSKKIFHMERAGASLGDIRALLNDEATKKLLETGELDQGAVSIGQDIGLITDIPAVGDLVQRIIREAKEIASKLSV